MATNGRIARVAGNVSRRSEGGPSLHKFDFAVLNLGWRAAGTLGNCPHGEWENNREETSQPEKNIIQWNFELNKNNNLFTVSSGMIVERGGVTVSWRSRSLAFSRDQPYNFSCLSGVEKRPSWQLILAGLGLIWQVISFLNQHCQVLRRNENRTP